MQKNMGNEAWSKIQLHWNLELKIWWQHILWIWGKIWSTSQSPFYTYNILFWSLGSQKSNASNDVQIEVKMKKLWPFEKSCTKLKGHFKMILKFNLGIWNPLQNDTNFKFTYYHFDVLSPLPREFHLGHSIHPKWTPHD